MPKTPLPKTGLYREDPKTGNAYRARYLKELQTLIASLRKQGGVERRRSFAADFSSPAAYARSLAPLRERYRAMLGWPLTADRSKLGPPVPESQLVARDDLGTIFRMRLAILPGLDMYGMLFLPPASEAVRVPLVIAQHGGLGTPERIAGFFDSANYNEMLRRVLVRGVAVFAPQLLLWAEEFGPKYDRQRVDMQLKQLGSSITAIEIHGIQRWLDYLVTRHELDPSRIGMVGLSYGGFYTLYTAAADPRIRVAVASCSFGDREVHGGSDWTWQNASHLFLDPEVAALVCPRALYVEVGARDELVSAKAARREAAKVKKVYGRLRVAGRFAFREFRMGHEFCKKDEPVDFLMRNL
jgi:dienelactone hydrolase